MSREDRIRTLDALYTAAGTVKGRAAMKTFLRELFAGKTYEEIADEMRVGNSLVRRVDKWLQDEFPGYEDAIKNMEKEFAERKKKSNDKYMYATSAMYRLKKKYPIHFLLFPWPKRK